MGGNGGGEMGMAWVLVLTGPVCVFRMLKDDRAQGDDLPKSIFDIKGFTDKLG